MTYLTFGITERSDQFDGHVVNGWRYEAISLWHITIQRLEGAKESYLVAAGEFYPHAIAETERFTILHMIAIWEHEHSSATVETA